MTGDMAPIQGRAAVGAKGGARMQMDEFGVYTVAGGKIAEEPFFFGG